MSAHEQTKSARFFCRFVHLQSLGDVLGEVFPGVLVDRLLNDCKRGAAKTVRAFLLLSTLISSLRTW